MELVKRAAAPVLYLLIAVLALWQSASKPMHNWDMIGYVAAAKSFEESDASALHDFTYRQLRESVTHKKYTSLASGKGDLYRETISEDPAAFAEQLPFYRIRPVYTGLIYLSTRRGSTSRLRLIWFPVSPLLRG